MFDELKKVKHFNEITNLRNLIVQNSLKNKTFKESSKCRGVFRTQASICDGAFLWIYLTAQYFYHKAPS